MQAKKLTLKGHVSPSSRRLRTTLLIGMAGKELKLLFLEGGIGILTNAPSEIGKVSRPFPEKKREGHT